MQAHDQYTLANKVFVPDCHLAPKSALRRSWWSKSLGFCVNRRHVGTNVASDRVQYSTDPGAIWLEQHRIGDRHGHHWREMSVLRSTVATCSQSIRSTPGRCAATAGAGVSVELHVRKFHCDNPGCERSIFVERVAGFADSYARRTVQLDELLRLVAFANGGECGSRVAAELRIPTCVSGMPS